MAQSCSAAGRSVDGVRQLGIELDDFSMVHSTESDESARLSDECRGRAFRRRPRFLIPTVLHASIDLQSPTLVGCASIPKAAERNADLDFVSAVDQTTARLPDEIRAQIGLTG